MLGAAVAVLASGGHFAAGGAPFAGAVIAVPIFQVLALFFGVMAGVHAIAAHHGDESAALLLVKPVLLTVAVEGFLVVLKNAASLTTGGGLSL